MLVFVFWERMYTGVEERRTMMCPAGDKIAENVNTKLLSIIW